MLNSWAELLSLGPSLSRGAIWAPQLPTFSGQDSWWDRTGGYVQQLGGASNLLPCLGEQSNVLGGCQTSSARLSIEAELLDRH